MRTRTRAFGRIAPSLGLASVLACVLLTGEARAAPAIAVYDGLGTLDGARVSGRVVRPSPLDVYGWEPRTELGRALRAVRGIFPTPEARQRVTIRVGALPFVVETDHRGYFELRLRPEDLRGMRPGEHAVDVRLADAPLGTPSAHGQLFLSPSARGAAVPPTLVISDLDDTAIDVGLAEHKVRAAYRALAAPPTAVRAVEGAPERYRELAEGGLPMVFITSRPTGLFAAICQTLALEQFPRIPLLMKRLGATRGAGKQGSLLDHRAYKLAQLALVKELFPGYRFALVGDSGEQDPEVYAQALELLGRENVRLVAIRKVRQTDHAGAPRFRGQILFSSFGELAPRLRELLAAPPPARPTGWAGVRQTLLGAARSAVKFVTAPVARLRGPRGGAGPAKR